MPSNDRSRRRTIGLTTALLLLVAVTAWAFYRPTPPQMGTDEDVFRTVDALFTAVTARDAKLVVGCQKRLADMHADGRLPTSSAAYLDGVIRTAQSGSWQPAAEKLYAFMKAQRRDGKEAETPRKNRPGKR